MKSAIEKILVAMMAVAGMLATASVARADDSVKAKVPFAFVVNGVELPAGDYVFTRDAGQPDLVEISTAAGRRVALTLTRAGDTSRGSAEQPSVDFERSGKQVFLTQITIGPGNSREIVTPALAALTAPAVTALTDGEAPRR